MRGYGGGGPKGTEKWDGDAGQEMAAQGGRPREVCEAPLQRLSVGMELRVFRESTLWVQCAYRALPNGGLERRS